MSFIKLSIRVIDKNIKNPSNNAYKIDIDIKEPSINNEVRNRIIKKTKYQCKWDRYKWQLK